MGKKYVATVMDRYYLWEDVFIFKCNHVIIGDINPVSYVFRDRYGNEYSPMLSPDLMSTEVPYAYHNVVELSTVYDIVGGDISLQKAISRYEEMCKEIVYFVGRTGENIPYWYSINLFQLLEDVEDMNTQINDNLNVNVVKNEEPVPLSIEYTNKINNKKGTEIAKENFEDLILDIIDGKYTLDELRKMREDLKENQDDLEQLVETLELQIESENNSSSFKIFGEVTVANSEDFDSEDDEETEEEKEAIKNRSIDIDALFKKVTKTLIAQDEAARRVIVELARKELDSRKKKEGILLTGPTGVGKTELMRLIAKYLNKPFYKVNSTQLTVPGYVGKDIEEVLWDLYVSCGRNLHDAENAIIFFDEIDKKGSSKKSDVSGQGVLNLLLPFIEGSTYDAVADIKSNAQKVKIDTSNMTVILGGAFTDVYKNLVEKNNVGFNGIVSSKPRYRKATTEDFVNKGQMTDEFMGRVTVVKLNDLSCEDIKRVMLESDESALKIQQEIFRKLGVKLTFTDGYVTEIAINAEKKKTGARGLNGIIDETTWVALDDVYSHPNEYEEVKLTEKTVYDPTNYQLVKKNKQLSKNKK